MLKNHWFTVFSLKNIEKPLVLQWFSEARMVWTIGEVVEKWWTRGGQGVDNGVDKGGPAECATTIYWLLGGFGEVVEKWWKSGGKVAARRHARGRLLRFLRNPYLP
jgi:hypothetical protein